jgi:hypothetical protein
MLYRVSRDSVRVEEVADDELLEFFPGNFTVFVGVDDLYVGGDVGSSGLEGLVHGPVAIDQPLGHLDRLADTVSVAVVGFDDLPDYLYSYLARLRHSSLLKSPPFSTWL